MRKKYISKSQIALSVIFPTGGKKHISFSPNSNGGSVYYSDDLNEQIGLESHNNYGRLYKLDESFCKAETIKEVVPIQPIAVENPSPAPVPTPVVSKPSVKQIHVSDLSAAKDYLCDRFGYSRTKLRGKNSITEAAKKEGIVFIGIE